MNKNKFEKELETQLSSNSIDISFLENGLIKLYKAYNLFLSNAQVFRILATEVMQEQLIANKFFQIHCLLKKGLY